MLRAHFYARLSVVLLLVAAACASPSPPARPAGGTTAGVAVHAAAPASSEALAGNPDAPQNRSPPVPRRLTDPSKLRAVWPSFGADGRRLVCAGHDGKRWRLWVVLLDGAAREPQPLTPDDFPLHATRPTWSPDGARIAFRASAGLNAAPGDIWVVGAEGKALRRVGWDDASSDFYPEWLFGGGWVVTRRGAGDRVDLVHLSEEGRATPITDNPAYDGKSSPAPDGKRVAFASDRSGQLRIWTVERSGGEPSVRPFTEHQARAPAWSPDGRWIAFESDRGGSYAIYVRHISGQPVLQLTRGDSDEQHPAWSPDGRWIAYDAHPKGPRPTSAIEVVPFVVNQQEAKR